MFLLATGPAGSSKASENLVPSSCSQALGAGVRWETRAGWAAMEQKARE